MQCHQSQSHRPEPSHQKADAVKEDPRSLQIRGLQSIHAQVSISNFPFKTYGVIFSPGALSESEYEEDPVELELAQDLNSRGLMKGQKSKLRSVLEFAKYLKIF